MGLTIHYNLAAKERTPLQARDLVEQLRQKALDLPFKEVGEIVDLEGDEANHDKAEKDHPHLWLLIQAMRYVTRDKHLHALKPKRIIAFSTWPGEGCEAANFGLAIHADLPNKKGKARRACKPADAVDWFWGSFCKTQYASNPEFGGLKHFLQCHLTVVRMLDHAAELGVVQEVHDEGEFWDDRDLRALADRVGASNSFVAAFVGLFKDALGGGVQSEITKFPNFEHLEAKGRKPKS